MAMGRQAEPMQKSLIGIARQQKVKGLPLWRASVSRRSRTEAPTSRGFLGSAMGCQRSHVRRHDFPDFGVNRLSCYVGGRGFILSECLA